MKRIIDKTLSGAATESMSTIAPRFNRLVVLRSICVQQSLLPSESHPDVSRRGWFVVGNSPANDLIDSQRNADRQVQSMSQAKPSTVLWSDMLSASGFYVSIKSSARIL